MTLPSFDDDKIYQESTLVDLYTDFIAKTGLRDGSADELILETDNPEYKRWLSRFIYVWERAEFSAT